MPRTDASNWSAAERATLQRVGARPPAASADARAVMPIASARARWRFATVSRGVLCAALLGCGTAHAGLFDDDEARKAILDLRQKLEQSNEQNRQKQAELNQQLLDQIGLLRSSLLDLNNQIELLRADNAKLRGQVEQLAREVGDVQVQVKDQKADIDQRLRRVEPQKTSVDGKEFMADAEEIRLYDAAMTKVRAGDFAGASTALAVFRSRYPASGYAQSALFWLGNAQYGKRDYLEAINSFRAFASAYPGDLRAPEALLAVANCQFELKDTKAARKTLDDLFKLYPNSEAALAGKERLAAIKG
jgi:tol-pal system protein YbgF